ncbi:MAG: DUF2264 domain-containing protein [Anaerolineae bacterium]|nr:DUF2264 domain-containing protein [Anaerolineae bacterium]
MIGLQDRAYWVDTLYRVVRPLFSALAANELKARMPVEIAHPRTRAHVSHLEAFGRALAGVAPWLQAEELDDDEAAMRDEVLRWAQQGLRNACDPASPDYMNFAGDSDHPDDNRQPLVDAAFLVHGMLRAPRVLWYDLDAMTQQLVINAVQQCRVVIPNYNNWLLFAAMIETFLHTLAARTYAGRVQADLMRIDVALRQHEAWYLGDGTYGDGPKFHWDYYNSYVIQPMMLDIVDAVAGQNIVWDRLARAIQVRAQRYAAVQERMIGPDGSFPVIGRSITYRTGAFQLLAQMALRDELPDGVTPGQVRGALTAVIKRTLGAAGTFDVEGWLMLGLAGHQPHLAESYISTGSLYLCTVGFLPLGLPPIHDFWASDPVPWTAQHVWSGGDLKADKAVDRDIVD